MAHDLIIRGGTVLDGTGADGVAADVAIDGDRITEIGDLSEAEANRDINATGKFVTCLLYTSPSPRDQRGSRMPSSA